MLVAQVGADGLALVDAVLADDAPRTLRSLPAIELLRKVWVQNYVPIERGLRWRTNDDGLPPATEFISSPYDPQAHLALKHATAWIGYKVHLTETCEPETPNLITNVQTVLAPIADGDTLPLIHQGLGKRALLPDQHLVDSGYVDADLLVASRRDFGIDLVGPSRADQHWQAREKTGLSAEHFKIDWGQQRATCPEGRTSVSWSPLIDNRRTEVIKIRFSEKDCSRCPSLTRCVRSKKKYPRRLITVRRQPAYEALRAAREREKTRDLDGAVRESLRDRGHAFARCAGVRSASYEIPWIRQDASGPHVDGNRNQLPTLERLARGRVRKLPHSTPDSRASWPWSHRLPGFASNIKLAPEPTSAAANSRPCHHRRGRVACDFDTVERAFDAPMVCRGGDRSRSELWRSSRRDERGKKRAVDLACNVALETSADLTFAQALFRAFLDVPALAQVISRHRNAPRWWQLPEDRGWGNDGDHGRPLTSSAARAGPLSAAACLASVVGSENLICCGGARRRWT